MTRANDKPSLTTFYTSPPNLQSLSQEAPVDFSRTLAYHRGASKWNRDDNKVISALGKYFNGIAELLDAKSRIAGTANRSFDIGTNREVIAKEFLEKHVPKRFELALGGDVFSINQQRSSQIDILVLHDMCIAF